MRRVTLVVVSISTILLAAGCTTNDPISQAAPASQAPAASIQATQVLRAQNTPVGQVIVDSNGYVLYRYDKDTAKPPRSNCLDDCAPKWPPVIDTGDIRLDGVDQALVGSVIRADFTRQVTIAGWPVYRYAADTAPGEAKGQGVGNVWFAVTPQGKKATGAAPPAANASANANANGNANNPANNPANNAATNNNGN